MEHLTVKMNQSIKGDFDLEDRLSKVPREYLCKGMFFSSVVSALGPEFDKQFPRLEGPPRFGRYVPFSDYPQVDYARLVGAHITTAFPGIPMREASRRFACREFEVFGKSGVGAVVMSLAGDPASALMRFPDMVKMVMKGGEVSAKHDDGGVMFSFHRFYGWLDCHFLGVVEGIVQHYGASPVIEAELEGWTQGTYRVRWE